MVLVCCSSCVLNIITTNALLPHVIRECCPTVLRGLKEEETWREGNELEELLA